MLSRLPLIALVLICCAAIHLPAAEQSRRPNIVIILADDAGWGDISCQGATHFSTPHIDALAAEGMRFTDAHSPSAVCTPSRYGLLTGRYGWRSWAGGGVLQGNDPLLIAPERVTIAELCQRAGYRTGMVGKWHLGFGRQGGPGFDPVSGIDYNGRIAPGPLECGFDSFFGIPMVGQYPHVFIRDHHVVGTERLANPIVFQPDERRPEFNVPWYERHAMRSVRGPRFTWSGTDPIAYRHEDLAMRLTEEAVAWIEAQDGERPFFFYFAHRSPHVPWRPHERFHGSTSFQSERARRYGESMVELDWSVGEIMTALGRGGFAEDTLVIVTSDNGAAWYYTQVDYAEAEGHFANGPFRGQKTDVYEGGHRVPFIVHWPSHVSAGTICDALVANTDLMATVADILGTPVPSGAAPDSISFLPQLQDPDRPGARTELIMDSPNGLLAVREGPWVYIPAQGGGGFRWRPYLPDYSRPPAQLYHLDDDPAQRHNRIVEEPGVAAALQARLTVAIQDRDPIPVPE
ncbi:MAG: sulfatase family protein [Planctomycetota bacterium]